MGMRMADIGKVPRRSHARNAAPAEKFSPGLAERLDTPALHGRFPADAGAATVAPIWPRLFPVLPEDESGRERFAEKARAIRAFHRHERADLFQLQRRDAGILQA